MAEESLKNKTVKGVYWSSIERFSVQGVQFIVTLVIARILGPREYGLIGMLAVFLAIAQTLVDSGFSQALIRKKERTEADYNTVFYFNLVIGIVLYGILYLSAPLVALFFHEPELAPILRVLGGIVIINGLAIVQRSLFIIEINFKIQTKATLISVIISGIIGVVTANYGSGAWALVYQQLSNSFLTTFLLWVYSGWRPQLLFSRQSFLDMFNFGSKLMMSGLLNTLYINIYQLVIGKVFNATSLGNYTRASQFATLPASSITDVMQRVLYPVLCKIQDDQERYRDISARFLRMSAFVVFPIMCVIAGVSKPMILLLLGKQWGYATYLVPPLCFAMMLLPVHALNLNAITVVGRSDLFLRLEIIKKVIGVAVIVVTVPFGVLVMCYGSIVGSILGLFVNTRYTEREIGYGLIRQIRDLLPVLSLSLVLFAIAQILCFLIENPWISLALSLCADLIVFAIVVYLCKFKEFEYIKNLKSSFHV